MMLMKTMRMMMLKCMTLGASLGNSLCSTVESITSPPVLSHNSGAPLWGWIVDTPLISLHTIYGLAEQGSICSPTCNKITFFLSAKLLSTNVLDNHRKVKPQVEWKCFSSARFVQLWHTFVLDNCAPLTLDWMVLDKLFNTGALWKSNSDWEKHLSNILHPLCLWHLHKLRLVKLEVWLHEGGEVVNANELVL